MRNKKKKRVSQSVKPKALWTFTIASNGQPRITKRSFFEIVLLYAYNKMLHQFHHLLLFRPWAIIAFVPAQVIQKHPWTKCKKENENSGFLVSTIQDVNSHRGPWNLTMTIERPRVYQVEGTCQMKKRRTLFKETRRMWRPWRPIKLELLS
jgi:hypothetical protein